MNALLKRVLINAATMIVIAGMVAGCNAWEEAETEFTVTPSIGEHGKVYPDTPQTVLKDGVYTFTVTPDAGYTTTIGGDCGGELAGNSYVTSPVVANCVVNFRFILGGETSAFLVTPKAGANGSVLTFAVKPETGYFATVVGCGGTLDGNLYTTGPITSNCTVSATFALPTASFTVTPKAGANGKIDPSIPQTVPNGQVTSFKVTADEGYTAKVIGCDGVLTLDSYKTSPITADCTVTASFESGSSEGDINENNAKKVLDTALVSLIVAQSSASLIFINHLVNGPSNRGAPGLTRIAGDELYFTDELPCDDVDLRSPVLNTGLAVLSEGELIRKSENLPFTFSKIKLNDFGGSLVCNLGSGSPGTMSNLLDGGPAPGPNVSITISSTGDDWLRIEWIEQAAYLHTFEKLPMIVNLGTPQAVLISGETEVSPAPWVDLTINWTNTFGEPDTLELIGLPAPYAPPYSETAEGALTLTMDSKVLGKGFTVAIPAALEAPKTPSTTTGAYLLDQYQDREIMTVSAKDSSKAVLLCQSLLPANDAATTKSGFFCNKLQYRVNSGEAKTYVLP